jgi:hypothetical protein
VQDGQEVIAPSGPADIVIDQYRLASSFNSCQVTAITNGKDKIVIQAKGFLHDPDKVGPNVDFVILHTFFNDGVVVSNVKLVPRADLLVKDVIAYLIPAQGQFNNYIHKRRDEPGDSAVRGRLPESGNAVRLTTLTSCLSVFSPRAALAIFTDGGAIHLSQPNLSTAVAEVNRREGSFTHVSLSQYLVHIAPGDAPFVLKGGEEFSFRVGISVAPNRLPVHGEFVIEVRRGGDPAPLLLSPMLGKLLVHEKCDFSDGASAGQTGRSPGNWRDLYMANS